MNFKQNYKIEAVKNRRLYEYFYNGQKETLDIQINKQPVGTVTGTKATRIWQKIME